MTIPPLFSGNSIADFPSAFNRFLDFEDFLCYPMICLRKKADTRFKKTQGFIDYERTDL
jgi:hypothetical protein